MEESLMSTRLYVGNLPKEQIDRDDLKSVFEEYGESVNTKVIKDRKTGKCRGFAFVTVPNDEVADQLIEKFNGHSFRESNLKIEKALPRSKSKKGNGEGKPESKSESSNLTKKRGSQKSRSSSKSGGSGSVQPDPRWADELSKLKEMLAAQQ
jgi:RNA recognition motif-containing protein